MGEVPETSLTGSENGSIIENRNNENHDPKNGRFTFAPSKVRMSARERKAVSSPILTDFPNPAPEDGRKCYEYGDNFYVFETDEAGAYKFGIPALFSGVGLQKF